MLHLGRLPTAAFVRWLLSFGRSHFRSRPSPRSEHPRKMAEAHAQLMQALERPVQSCISSPRSDRLEQG
jgi:hypothetical protein